jgi:hypothetical protein
MEGADRSLIRWAPGGEAPVKPQLPAGIVPPRFRSRKQIVAYCESRAAMVERQELDPRRANALATLARVALEAYELEIVGRLMMLERRVKGKRL